MGTINLWGRSQLFTAMLTPDVAVRLNVLWFALTTRPVAAADDGRDLAEPAGGSYVRTAYPLDAEHWTSSGYDAFTNALAIELPTPAEDWGKLVGWALASDSETGSLFASGELTPPLTPAIGEQLVVQPYTLVLSVGTAVEP